MLGVLLESRAKTQRRGGGVALSVAVHVAIIGVVVVGTVQGKSAPPEKAKVEFLKFPTPAPTPVTVRQVVAEQSSIPSLPTTVTIRRVDAPTIVPVDLPPIGAALGTANDSIVIGGPARGSGVGRSVIDGEPSTGGNQWNVNEVLMHILAPAKPRYPESLRSAGVDGLVLVQFVVDTTGRVDPNSLRFLSSTHDLFSRAVRDAMGNFRFRPAEVGGRRVAALAQMPFEFRITGR